MTSRSFEFAIGAYLLMGVVLLIRGPLNEALKDAVTTSVGTPFARAMTSRPVLPNYKIVILRVVLSLGILLLWPILLPGVLRENRRRLDHLKKHFGRPGLRFVRMGGEARCPAGHADTRRTSSVPFTVSLCPTGTIGGRQYISASLAGSSPPSTTA